MSNCTCQHGGLISHYMNHYICERRVLCAVCSRPEHILREGSFDYVDFVLREEVFPQYDDVPPAAVDMTYKYCKLRHDFRVSNVMFCGNVSCKWPSKVLEEIAALEETELAATVSSITL